VQVGEMLASRDSETGEPRFQTVRARMIREAPQVMRLTVKDEAGRVETVVVTPNHPYLRPVLNNGGTVDLLRAVSMEPGGPSGGLWTAAGYLRVGDKLDSVSGVPLEVVRVEVDSTPTKVYNFEVVEDHTYAVGELQAWVHNARALPTKFPFAHLWPANGIGQALRGSAYKQVRKDANKENRKIRNSGVVPPGHEIHEICPVKFGGSPTDPNNKVFLPKGDHGKITAWFNMNVPK
jgi:Pretoxin HINT domain